jgi:uncharacterized protein
VIYIDSSVALPRLLFEPTQFWQEKAGFQPIAQIRDLERGRRLRSDRRQYRSGANALTGIELLQLDMTVLARALEPWPTAIRTLDALHLASADYLRRQGEPVEIASYDNRLLAAACALGIPLAAL